jgi:hypothetical protein
MYSCSPSCGAQPDTSPRTDDLPDRSAIVRYSVCFRSRRAGAEIQLLSACRRRIGGAGPPTSDRVQSGAYEGNGASDDCPPAPSRLVRLLARHGCTFLSIDVPAMSVVRDFAEVLSHEHFHSRRVTMCHPWRMNTTAYNQSHGGCTGRERDEPCCECEGDPGCREPEAGSYRMGDAQRAAAH